MDIIIPTLGRKGHQETLNQLWCAGLRPVVVVQQEEYEEDAYWRDIKNVYSGISVAVLPGRIETIAPTRQWILENVGSSRTLVMLDDDLTFYKRRDDEPEKLRDITNDELKVAFGQLEIQLTLEGYAHAGFAAREGANRNTARYLENTRIMRVLGYRRDILLQEKLRFDEMEVMEDFHVALSLLERGYPNVILNDYAHNQAGSGKAGGCSTFRTPEMQARNAHLLAKLHPHAQAVQRVTKGSFGGGERTDVRIQWKKAYDSGRKD